MSRPNVQAVFSIAAHNQFVEGIVTAHNVIDLTSGTSYLVAVADTEWGGFLSGFRVKVGPANNSAATVVRFWDNDGERAVTSITASTDVIADTAHGLENGDRIRFTVIGGGAAGLDENVDHYIINKNANDFQLSLTKGGSSIAITSDGTGTSRYRVMDVRSGIWPTTLAVAARSCIIGELGMPATTTTATSALPDFYYPRMKAISPGHKLIATVGTAPGGSCELSILAELGRYYKAA